VLGRVLFPAAVQDAALPRHPLQLVGFAQETGLAAQRLWPGVWPGPGVRRRPGVWPGPGLRQGPRGGCGGFHGPYSIRSHPGLSRPIPADSGPTGDITARAGTPRPDRWPTRRAPGEGAMTRRAIMSVGDPTMIRGTGSSSPSWPGVLPGQDGAPGPGAPSALLSRGSVRPHGAGSGAPAGPLPSGRRSPRSAAARHRCTGRPSPASRASSARTLRPHRAGRSRAPGG
jgi:hypothetical protein